MNFVRKIRPKYVWPAVVLFAFVAAVGSAITGAVAAFEIAWIFLTALVAGAFATALESRRRISDIRQRVGVGFTRVERKLSPGQSEADGLRERRVLVAIEGERRSASERHGELADTVRELTTEVRELREEVARLSGQRSGDPGGGA